MASAFHRPDSFSIEDAAERKPWPVISSCAKPSRRKAALIVFSDMQRAAERIDGKRNFPPPVIALKLAQDRHGARRQRDAMRALHFHLFGRYRPNARVQIEFRPFRRAKLAGAHESQGEQFERRPCFRSALIAGERA